MRMPADNSQDFAPPPAGTHAAICYRVIDLGTQKGEYMGQPKIARKIMLSWELPDEKMEDGKPFTVHKRYTLSSNEKATLRKHLEAWRGKAFEEADFGPGGFDIQNILGKPCMLTLLHEEKQGKTYANIAAVGKLTKGITIAPQSNPGIYLSLDDFHAEIFATLPEGIRKVIASSPEYIEAVNPKGNQSNGNGHGSSDDSDVPF